MYIELNIITDWFIAGTPKKSHKRVEDNKKDRADSDEGHYQTIVSRGNHPRGINRLSSKPLLENPLMMMIFLLQWWLTSSTMRLLLLLLKRTTSKMPKTLVLSQVTAPWIPVSIFLIGFTRCWFYFLSIDGIRMVYTDCSKSISEQQWLGERLSLLNCFEGHLYPWINFY